MNFILRVGRLVAATAVIAGVFAGPSLAAPAIVQQNRIDGPVIEVRDGCGPGFRYSRSRAACVPDRGPAPPPYYVDRRGPPLLPPPPPMYRPGYRPAPPPFVCPPGQRFSNSMQRCVWR